MSTALCHVRPSMRGIFWLILIRFIGFSFWQSNSSQQGLQNVLFSVFMMTAIFTALIQQIIPRFVIQRSLYEVRERPSKAYSFLAFLLANILVEIPYQILLGILVYASYYYSVFGYASPGSRVKAFLANRFQAFNPLSVRASSYCFVSNSSCTRVHLPRW